MTAISHPSARGLPGRRARLHPRVAVGVATPIALAVGLLAAIDPLAALIIGFAVGATAVCLTRTHLAVAMFAATVFFEEVVVRGVTPVKVSGAVVLISGTTILLLGLRGRVRPAPTWQLHPVILACSIALVTWAIASASWAVSLGQVRSNGTRLLTDVLVMLMIPLLVRSTSHLRTMGWSMVGASMSGVLLGTALGHQLQGRATGMFNDPNEFATATVIAAGFALTLGESSSSFAARWGGRIAASASLVAVVATASRTGVIAAVFVFIALFITARGTERVRLAGIGSCTVAAVTAWIMLAPTGLATANRLSGEDSTGRTDLWRVAWNQFTDNPLHGVGLGNYPALSIRYLQGDVEHMLLFTRLPRTVHNTPLELLAELGVVGFSLFYAVAIACLVSLVRTLRSARSCNEVQLVGAVRGVLVGLVAVLFAGLTLSGLYIELLWVLLGCCVAAASIVRTTVGANARAHQSRLDEEAAWIDVDPSRLRLAEVETSGLAPSQYAPVPGHDLQR